MRNISRRDFLKSGAFAMGLTIVPNSILGKTHGFVAPSDKLNIAGIPCWVNLLVLRLRAIN